MALEKYKEKRNFAETPEPAGGPLTEGQFRFVVQRHDASRLHYDLRLELGGVLKSWAVPKGPSLDSKDKRLAMMTEDHPVDYLDFEGTIPAGNYGAGTMIVWDHGTFQPVNKDHEAISEKEALAGIDNGELKFSLKGEKLNGEFVLVQLKNAKEGNAWLLIKHKDEFASAGYDSEKDLTDAQQKQIAINEKFQGELAEKPARKTPVKKAAAVKEPVKKKSPKNPSLK